MIDDPNYPSSVLLTAARALKPGVPPEEIFEIAEATRADLKQGEENSPYPEVSKSYQLCTLMDEFRS